MTDIRPQRIHFIGIGGVGMSGIALIAQGRGFTVSGSDLKRSRTSDKLAEAGVRIFIGHEASHVDETYPDVVVISSAIPEKNPELARARELGIQVWRRAKMLAYLGEGRKTLAVAGTHGKTTTSSMLATTLSRLNADPTFLIGGTVDGYDTNAVEGKGEYYVVEADESDGTFLYLSPYVAIVTNIEADHLDHYGNLEAIEEAFTKFMASVPEDGAVVICGENPHIVDLARSTGRTVVTYGFGQNNDVVCQNLKPAPGAMAGFSVTLPDGQRVQGNLSSNPGKHNVLNATAVIACLYHLGYAPGDACRAVSQFSGVRRRFDHVAYVGGVEIVDDYGHHPTEIKATLAAAASLDYKHVHVLFQPHRYSRTAALAPEFADAFVNCDSVTFMDVYSAGEAPIPGVSGKTVLSSVVAAHPRTQTAWMPHRAEIVNYLASKLKPGDLLITLGAGDVTEMGPLVAKALTKE